MFRKKMRNHCAKPSSLIENDKGFVFSYETFFRFTELEKGFVRDGSVDVPAVRSFLGFVDFDDRFLGFSVHMEAFRHLRNLCGEF
jgi:hypothetical protein